MKKKKKKIPFLWLGGTWRLLWQNLSCVEGESRETGRAPCIQSNFSVNYKVPDKINSSLKSNWIQFKYECVVSVWRRQRAGGEMPPCLSALQRLLKINVITVLCFIETCACFYPITLLEQFGRPFKPFKKRKVCRCSNNTL